MSVKLRKKTLSNGKVSLYLDIYQDGHRHYEFLKMQLHKKTKSALEAEHNKETLKLAESIAGKRQQEIQADRYDLVPGFRKNVNFILYYEKWVKDYTNKDIRIARYSLEHFKSFAELKGYKASILPNNITDTFCRQFKSYLDEKLNGETPYNYFTKFKKLLKQATKEKVFFTNPAEEVENKRKEGLKKDILNFKEIQLLANTECGNSEVKRAFLFSLNTGLRHCDILSLKWKNIDGNKLKIAQNKTDKELMSDLNATAIKLLGERGKADENVFNLPSHTASLKSLDLWTQKAKIDKNITWHCARHSFAVNLLWVKSDIKTVSSLLGHSGLKHTEKYTRVVDELKKEAVNNLPEITL
ncbi:MAG: Tyrosine recombinase XerC [Bacteroidia bacterium]|nr:Tyrosine recombinase XerC [Bacteroidia bacterium]